MQRASPVALFCIFLPAAILPAAERIRFAGPLTIRDVLREPVTVHTGDFDADGKLDLVCSNGSSTVSVLLQDPLDRETWKEFEIRVGSSSYFTRGGDFDGDGASDLVVADGASTAYYLRSQGDGTFERPVPIIQARGPRWPATGDWNGDGRLDLATANLATSTLTIFVNEATPEGVPRFRMTQPSPLGRPHALEALDFDGDGVLDLVAGMGSVGIELHRGNGDGTFTFTPSNVGEIGCAQHVAVGDFNADGQDDLAPTCRDDGTAYVGISNGDGRYTRTLSAPFAPGTESSAAADLTRDGKDDLVLASESSPRLRVHPSLGDGTFGPPVEFGPIGDEPLFVIAADLDADGLHDVVSADSGGSTITVFIGGEGERFLESEDTITGVTSARGFDVGDFDRDGVPDVFLGDAALPRAYIYLEPGGRSPMAPSMVSDLAHRYRNIAVADLNGDGVPDLAGTSFELDSVVIALLDAQGRAHGELEIPGGPFQATAVGRIDPGPTLDLAVPVTTANEISIFPGTGDGRFEPVKTVPTIDRPRSVTLGDVNGDGRTDLAVLQTQLAVVHLQKDDGTFEPPATVLADSMVELTDVAVADLDGDGFGDVVLSDEETQAALVFPGRADGGLGEMIPIPLGVPALAIHLADVDGDGRIDVTASSAAAQSVAIAYNLGSGRFEPVSLESVGVAPTAHRILDLNADGVSDILAFASTSAAVRLGSRAGAVLPFRRGDANDDGRVDITDGVYTLNFLFVGGAEPPCLEAANANDDAELDLTDSIHVLRFLFLSGPPPLPPGPESCGPDPAVSPGGLGCSAHGSCP